MTPSPSISSPLASQPSTVTIDRNAPTTKSVVSVNAVATTLSDSVDADVASAVGVTITAGNTGGTGQVDVAPSSVWAILFRALMQ